MIAYIKERYRWWKLDRQLARMLKKMEVARG